MIPIACAAAERDGNGPRESRSMSQSQRQSQKQSQSPPSSIPSLSHSYALLKQQLEVAARSEDYKEAARIRDSLKLLEEEEPILHLRRLMKEAIADERFEEGDFEMIYIDRIGSYVAIAPFSLSLLGDDDGNII